MKYKKHKVHSNYTHSKCKIQNEESKKSHNSNSGPWRMALLHSLQLMKLETCNVQLQWQVVYILASHYLAQQKN